MKAVLKLNFLVATILGLTFSISSFAKDKIGASKSSQESLVQMEDVVKETEPVADGLKVTLKISEGSYFIKSKLKNYQFIVNQIKDSQTKKQSIEFLVDTDSKEIRKVFPRK